LCDAQKRLDNFNTIVIAEWGPYFERILAASKSPNGFYVGNKLSYADLVSFNAFHTILAKNPNALSSYPLLAAHTKRIGERPRVAAWIKSRPVTAE
jgi:glutathione S-transferase